jgi:hypothetical protein
MNEEKTMSQQYVCKNFINLVAAQQDTDFIEDNKQGYRYNNKEFYVDDILVARALNDKGGKLCLIMPSTALGTKVDSFKSHIQKYCPLHKIKYYLVPQQVQGSVYNNDFTKDEIARVVKLVINTNKPHLDKQHCAQEIIRYFNVLDTLNKYVFDYKNDINEVRRTYELAVQAGDELTKKVTEFIDNNEYGDVVGIAFFNKPCVEAEKVTGFRHLLRDKLNPTGTLSFLDVDENFVYSNELDLKGNPKAVMTVEDALKLGSSQYTGSLKRGQKYGDYTIMNKSTDIIKIGCNNYDKRMLSYIFKKMIAMKGLKLPKVN